MTTFPLPSVADRVLVASPNVVIRQRVLESLTSGAGRVEQAVGGAEALVYLENGPWHKLFLDRHLLDLDAEELSQTVRQRFPTIEVVIVDDESGARGGAIEPQTSSDEPLRLCEQGHPRQEANGYWEKACVSSERSQHKNLAHKIAVDEEFVTLPGMIGGSAIMQPVYRMTHLVAARDTTVLIMGPTGSGKELIARAIHQLSPRAARSFAVVNCAAIPETMLEAELFGYSRGAFTGAMQSYAGRIQAAHLGTLFLDEIGDMPLSLQPKLLRFLEQKELQRLGSAQVVRVDTRVVSATNVDLLELVREGKFREDLYYRLSAFPLMIPPLRARPDDIAQLAEYFVDRFCIHTPSPRLSDSALEVLQAHHWPGNVRELQNVIERALILAGNQSFICPSHLMLPQSELASPHIRDRAYSSEPSIREF